MRNSVKQPFKPVKARYVRLTILNSGSDNIARIGDVEIYGSVLSK